MSARSSRNSVTHIDKWVAERIILRRRLLRINRSELARRIGISSNQLYKSEAGTNRIGAGRLYDIATALKVPVSFFFEGLLAELPSVPEMAAFGQTTKGELIDPEAMRFAKAFNKIRSQAVQRRLAALIRELIKQEAKVSS